MSDQLTRRSFLSKSALAGGGLVIGFSFAGCSAKPAAMAAKQVESVSQNAYLTIATDGKITFFTPFSEMGQGIYTGITTLVAEELEVPVDSISVEIAPADPAYTNDLLGTQVTGGSTAVRDSYTKLRQAAAEARVRLVEAAANRWGVSADSLSVSDGVIRAPSGDALSFGEVASDAASVTLSNPVTVKKPADFQQIGKVQRRLDTPAKTDGTAEYGIDVRRPGQVYAAIAMSPALKGKVASFDDSAARASDGVIDIVETPAGIVVVADAWWSAKAARDKLDVTWDKGANADLTNARISGGLTNTTDANAVWARVAREEGDAATALESASKRIEARYELPVLAHATMEPLNCTAEFDADGHLHLYVGTQVQIVAQQVAAGAAGIPPENVHVHTTFLGGGFGRRLEVDFIPPAVIAAKQVGRPVQLIWSREDDMTHDIYRPPVQDRLAAGIDADGNITAWSFDIVSPSPTARWAPAVVETANDPFAIEAAANFPYAVPNVLVRHLRHEVGFDVGYWRSVSHATNCFAGECFMDELADEAGKDPYEFRRALLEEQPLWRNVLELAAEQAGWGKAPQGRFHGIALMEGYNTYMAQVAEVSVVDGKAKVHRVVCAVDCGQVINPDTVVAQVQGSIVFGLSAALWGEINIEGGEVQEQNFDRMRILRINESPEIETHIVASTRDPGGIGEPATAVVAPAVANAIFAATGERVRQLPFSRAGLA